MAKPDPWLPTPENINKLPRAVQAYIHGILARGDPAGDVAALTLVNDQNAQIKTVSAIINAENMKLRAALEKLIRMNRQHAEDQYGDADKAESWACVAVARAALSLPPPKNSPASVMPKDWSDSEKLRKLALWFDKYDFDRGDKNDEVQQDLRRIATELELTLTYERNQRS